MKPSQRQLYAERIERAVAFLESRADGDAVPALAEIADAAGMSAHHFHRVFRLMTGETVGEATRRVRLSRAIPALAGQTTVTAAAGPSGYATSQGFARAFKGRSGGTASELRADPARLDALAASLRIGGQASDTPLPLTVEIASVEPIRLLVLRNVGDYAELNAAYTRLFELVMDRVPPDALQGIYGVPEDDPRSTPPEKADFLCGLATGEAGQAGGGLEAIRLRPGPYARIRHHGDYDGLWDMADRATAAVIASLDRELADAPMFVHYLDDPEEVEQADLRSDLYLPLS